MAISATKKSFISSVILLIASSLLFASSCGVVRMQNPVLQPENLISPSMVGKLKPGMTKEQVELVLGRPVNSDEFEGDNWSFIYAREDSEGNLLRQHLSVVFKGDELVEIRFNSLEPTDPDDEAKDNGDNQPVDIE